MGAGLLTTLRASFASEREEIRAAWLLIGAIALFVADSPVSWDLRNANSNLVMLGLVLAGYALIGRHPVAGAVRDPVACHETPVASISSFRGSDDGILAALDI